MIIFLCPSRERPDLLEQSYRSLESTCDDPDSWRMYVYLDYDEPRLDDYIDLQSLPNILMICGPRHGYQEFHRYINALVVLGSSEYPKADWFVLWNDDCLMDSKGWDLIIQSHRQAPPTCLNFNDSPGQNWFPAINMCWFQVVGHFSLSPHCDTWVQDVAALSGRQVMVDGVKIDHIRDQIDDPTKAQSQSAYPVTSPDYYNPHFHSRRVEDAANITNWFTWNLR